MAAAVGSLMRVSHLHAGGAGAQLGRVPGQALGIGRNGDDGLGDRLFQGFFGVAFEHGEKHGRDLLGAQVLAHQRDAVGRAEDALDRTDRAVFLVVFLSFLPEGELPSRRTVTTEGVHLSPSRLGRTSACHSGSWRRPNCWCEIDADVGHDASSVPRERR